MSFYWDRTFCSRRLVAAVVALISSALLTGCGGGTSNQQPPPPPPPPITATETVLYSFVGNNNGATDGYSPLGVIKDPAGNFYGTTAWGGTGFGGGTAFRLDTSGNESVLYNFQGLAGAVLSPTLIMSGAGTFYGTTGMGGSLSCNFGGGVGCGTVFSVDSSGNETVLYNFTGFNGDGSYPGALMSDGAGNFYGTTWQGGNSQCFCGTVFKVDSAGNETVLHAFTGVPDGSYPESSQSEFGGSQVVRDSAGNLYGTTSIGGTAGYGTVFKLDTAGHETLLHSFSGQSDGIQPGNVVMDNAGNLYGTTLGGGVSGNGIVFKVDTSGHETVLHSFTGAQNHDGSDPTALVMDSSGNLYGITQLGGSTSNCPGTTNTIGGCGTFFKLDSTGHETVLYSFKGLPNADGQQPVSLTMDSAGNFYGTTSYGGVACTVSNSGCGTVFKIVLH